MLVQGERVWEGLRNVDGRAVFRTCRVSTGQIDDLRQHSHNYADHLGKPPYQGLAFYLTPPARGEG